MKNYKAFTVTFVLLSPLFAFPHGEDKAGPHGGFIRMPGAYHTEIVLDGKNKLKVYLLNMQWKTPSIVNSKLQISYVGKDTLSATCKTEKNFYLCTFSAAVDLTKEGSLKVASQREGQEGMEVTYPLPLKLEIPAASKKNHESHH